MGIVNIDDDLHEQIRMASTVSNRSINAQATFWIKIGMLCSAEIAGEREGGGVLCWAERRDVGVEFFC